MTLFFSFLFFHLHSLIQSPLQGLLAVPFVLKSQPTAAYEERDEVQALEAMAQVVHRRYAEIMRDVEDLVNDHSRFPVLHIMQFLESISCAMKPHFIANTAIQTIY